MALVGRGQVASSACREHVVEQRRVAVDARGDAVVTEQRREDRVRPHARVGDERCGAIGLFSGSDPGTGDHERHVVRLLPRAQVLAVHAVCAQVVAVVGEEHDDGVLRDAAVVELAEQPPEERVDLADARVVAARGGQTVRLREPLEHARRALVDARATAELVVPVRRNGDIPTLVPPVRVPARDVGVVGLGHAHEEAPRVIRRLRELVELRGCEIGDDAHGPLTGRHVGHAGERRRAVSLPGDRDLRVELPVRARLATSHRRRAPRTVALPAVPRGALARLDVPLAHVARRVAGGDEVFGEVRQALADPHLVVRHRVRDPEHVVVVRELSGHEARARRRADRVRRVRAREAHPAAAQPVYVGRVAQRGVADRAGLELIAHEDEDVRAHGISGRRRRSTRPRIRSPSGRRSSSRRSRSGRRRSERPARRSRSRWARCGSRRRRVAS